MIGDILMDQSKIAGVGNIYRAEILYKARVHPLTKVSNLSDAELSFNPSQKFSRSDK